MQVLNSKVALQGRDADPAGAAKQTEPFSELTEGKQVQDDERFNKEVIVNWFNELIK